MDVLSHLLSLYPVRTALDTRCSSSAAWAMERAALEPGAAPYHLVVAGGAVLRIEGRPALELHAGDMLVLARGQAHTLDIGARTPAGSATEILCGQFHFCARSAGPPAARRAHC